MASGGPTHTAIDPTTAAGRPLINTVGVPGGRMGPPTWGIGGVPGVCIGQVCRSVVRAAGFTMPEISGRTSGIAKIWTCRVGVAQIAPMPFEWTARIGDHASRIARESGFKGYPPIWNDPGNEALREMRGTPHILAEGDRLVIPPAALREVRRPTDRRHRFVAERPVLVVRIEVAAWDGRHPPLDDLVVRLDGVEVTPTSATEGTVEIPVEPLTDFCTLAFGDRVVDVRVGFLAPVTTLAGCRERLANLGYRPGDSADPADRDLRSAIEEFQCDHDLAVDGIPGPGTQRALVTAHGC